MKKVAVMGLYNYENLGDPIITLCVKYLVESLGYEALAVGFQPKRSGIRFNIYKTLRQFVFRNISKEKQDRFLYWIMEWFITPHCKKIVKESDAVIFGCGSYKYSTQNLWMTYSVVVDLAQKYGKPIMFHGMNIEKYNSDDERCLYLAKKTNYKVVKMMTTRDGDIGIYILKQYYLKSNIPVYAVGDSAFWLNECFELKELERTDVIGINLVRDGIFKDYGGNLSDEALKAIYIDVIKGLDERKIRWELFTNGMKEDLKFGQDILSAYDDKNRKIVHPNKAEDLINLIRGCKAIIGARLHACVIAYATDTPFVGFYWDEKLKRFAADNILENRFLSEQDLSGNELLSRLDDTMNCPFDSVIRARWKEKNREAINCFLQNYV